MPGKIGGREVAAMVNQKLHRYPDMPHVVLTVTGRLNPFQVLDSQFFHRNARLDMGRVQFVLVLFPLRHRFGVLQCHLDRRMFVVVAVPQIVFFVP